MRVQFLPCNITWAAKEELKNLKQSGSVHDYIKSFCSLMLGVDNMVEEDKLFNFMNGLSSWVQAELRQQDVQDLNGAIAAAEKLMDYRNSVATSGKKDKMPKTTGGSRNNRKESDAVQKGKEKDRDGKAKFGGCFICQGPHQMRDCPKREILNE